MTTATYTLERCLRRERWGETARSQQTRLVVGRNDVWEKDTGGRGRDRKCPAPRIARRRARTDMVAL